MEYEKKDEFEPSKKHKTNTKEFQFFDIDRYNYLVNQTHVEMINEGAQGKVLKVPKDSFLRLKIFILQKPKK